MKESQNGQDDLSPFCAFQRFCLLIVLINGGKVEENDAESMTKFLRQIEVYKQVKQIDKIIQESKVDFNFDALNMLLRSEKSLELCESRSKQLQMFVNEAIRYATALRNQRMA